jgi:hypothetical protein
MGYRKLGVRIPPARFLDIPERLFPPKRFQRNGGVDGFSKDRRNRYEDGIRNDFAIKPLKTISSWKFHALFGIGAIALIVAYRRKVA